MDKHWVRIKVGMYLLWRLQFLLSKKTELVDDLDIVKKQKGLVWPSESVMGRYELRSLKCREDEVKAPWGTSRIFS